MRRAVRNVSMNTTENGTRVDVKLKTGRMKSPTAEHTRPAPTAAVITGFISSTLAWRHRRLYMPAARNASILSGTERSRYISTSRRFWLSQSACSNRTRKATSPAKVTEAMSIKRRCLLRRDVDVKMVQSSGVSSSGRRPDNGVHARRKPRACGWSKSTSNRLGHNAHVVD